jgi:hypothetical protein
MNLEQMRTTAERLRNIPLPAVLEATGAGHDRYDKARWHTPKGVISVTGMKFFNWNCSVGGGGAIDLIIHLYGLDFKGALAWLSRHLPGDSPTPSLCARSQPNLKLPIPEVRKLPDVKTYLIAERRISPAVIDYLIQCGDLYADDRSNAVFLMCTTGNVPIGAELRGIGRRQWRGMAGGSRKDLGYFSIRNVCVDGMILCESAIDAISCFMINPHYYCISTAGARPAPCWLEPLVCQYPKVYCAFDADPTGDTMADAMIKVHPSVKRLRPQQHDWNDMLRARA